MNCYDHFYTRKLKRKRVDIRDSDFDSQKLYIKKLKNVQNLDRDYEWFFKWVSETDDQTKVIRSEDQIENENENENENEIENKNENENENEHEDEHEYVDENDEDPQYRIFLENLTEHGKSYKLNISQNEEEPRFIYYEEPDNLDWCDELQTSTDNSGDDVSEDLQISQKDKTRVIEKKLAISMKKAVRRKKKIHDRKSITQPHLGMLLDSTIKEVSTSNKIDDRNSKKQAHRGIIVDPSYQMFKPSEHVVVKAEEDSVEYEKIVMAYDSDSDVLILDKVQSCGEVNDKQLLLVEKQSSLREKLMHILEQPYNEKEYEELSDYIEQKKPICRLLDLRGRAISSALSGVRKSVLDDGPGCFRRMLNAAQNDPPKALNLLRMFRFWLEHIPNKNVFAPWRDEHILKVRPIEKMAVQLDTMLLMDK